MSSRFSKKAATGVIAALLVASCGTAALSSCSAQPQNSNNSTGVVERQKAVSDITAVYYRDSDKGIAIVKSEEGKATLTYNAAGAEYSTVSEVSTSPLELVAKIYDEYGIEEWGDIRTTSPNPSVSVTFTTADGKDATYDTSMPLPANSAKMFSDVEATLMPFVDGEGK